MLEKYPRIFYLKNGTEVTIRPMKKEDEEVLHDFFTRLPIGDRLYLKDDVGNREVIAKWARNLNYDVVLPLLAFVDDRLVADGTLHQKKSGWKRHVGTLRLVVDKEYRHLGLGVILIDELIETASDFGLEQVIAEVANKDTRAISVFTRAGFEKVAVIEGLIKDQKGMNTDVAVMIKKVVPPYEI